MSQMGLIRLKERIFIPWTLTKMYMYPQTGLMCKLKKKFLEKSKGFLYFVKLTFCVLVWFGFGLVLLLVHTKEENEILETEAFVVDFLLQLMSVTCSLIYILKIRIILTGSDHLFLISLQRLQVTL